MFYRPTPLPNSCLPFGQTRVIHASAGLQLRVLRGRLWVTQPHCEQDLFLYAGQTLALNQDWIVIQADMPAMQGACEYQLEAQRLRWYQQRSISNNFFAKLRLRLNRFGFTAAQSR
jgi:Protein of unknown function (DUF2917)